MLGKRRPAGSGQRPCGYLILDEPKSYGRCIHSCMHRSKIQSHKSLANPIKNEEIHKSLICMISAGQNFITKRYIFYPL